MTILLQAHSGFRYVVLLLGLATICYALFGLVARRPLGRAMMGLSSAFAGAFHLQILLGLAVLFSSTAVRFVPAHVITLLFAAVCAQLVPSVMRRRRPERRTYAPYLIGALAALALAAAGILAVGSPILG
jgi:hypothetical protein